MKSAILFIIFKREDTARAVMERIREAKPPRLYVAADAPREGVEGEKEACMRTREVVKMVDWECEIKTLFQTQNQGCGKGPANAITWFFEQEEAGIILEDDCVPHPDFFDFCDEMLERYREDERISLVTGRNVFGNQAGDEGSYFLSALHFCWGWASWRRVWKNYSYTMEGISFWSYFRHLMHLYGWNWHIIAWRLLIYRECRKQPERDIWDYQFAIETQCRETFTIVPAVNMVTNIGFDERASHTSGLVDQDIEAKGLYPLTHPKRMVFDPKRDAKYAKKRAKT